MTERRRCESTGKQCLAKADAHFAARNLNSHQQNDGWPVHAFQCGDHWHTGHVRASERRGKRRKRKGMIGSAPRPLTPHDQLPPELQ